MENDDVDREAPAPVEGGSRRRLLEVVGGLALASALTALDEDGAAAKGHGRNRGHHPGKSKDNRKGHGHGSNWFLRGHSVYLNNPANARATAVIEGTEVQYLGLCTLLGKIDLPPSKDALFDTHNTTLWLQINRHYYFVFINAALIRPRIVAGIMGTSDLCPPRVTSVFEESMSEGDEVTITLEGLVFTARRNTDKTDFKYWSLYLPATL